MVQQIKYAGRIHLRQRLISLAVAAVINLFFGILGAGEVFGLVGNIAGITLSALALTGLCAIVVVADFASIRTLFTAPDGYTVFLTPTPRWKILLGRVASIVVLDVVTIGLGVTGLAFQAWILRQFPFPPAGWDHTALVMLGLVILLNYSLLVLLCFFVAALCKSLFYRLRATLFWGILSLAAISYLFNVLNLLLAVPCPVSRFGLYFSITLQLGVNGGMILYLGLLAAKTAALFAGTVYLMEGKVNI